MQNRYINPIINFLLFIKCALKNFVIINYINNYFKCRYYNFRNIFVTSDFIYKFLRCY